MNALVLTLFVSAILVGLGLLAFGFAVRQRDHDATDRLSFLPLAEDDAAPVRRSE